MKVSFQNNDIFNRFKEGLIFFFLLFLFVVFLPVLVPLEIAMRYKEDRSFKKRAYESKNKRSRQ